MFTSKQAAVEAGNKMLSQLPAGWRLQIRHNGGWFCEAVYEAARVMPISNTQSYCCIIYSEDESRRGGPWTQAKDGPTPLAAFQAELKVLRQWVAKHKRHLAAVQQYPQTVRTKQAEPATTEEETDWLDEEEL